MEKKNEGVTPAVRNRTDAGVSLPAQGYWELPVEKIVKSNLNPRKGMDQEKLKELAASIREKGILEPILVRPVPLDSKSGIIKGGSLGQSGADGPTNGLFEVVCGSRRLAAANLVGLKVIPAIVRELDDKQVLEFQVIENLQREDINPMEEAEGYARILLMPGYNSGVLADKVGKSERYIKSRLKFTLLESEIRESLKEGRISAGHALILLKLTREQDRAKLHKRILEEALSAQATGNVLFEYMCRLDRAEFDKKECKGCEHNGSAILQEELFKDRYNNLKGNCANPECYKRKEKEMTDAKIEKLKSRGYRVSTKKEVPGAQMFYGYTNNTDLFKARKKCEKCKDFTFIVRGKKIEPGCANKECFEKTVHGRNPEKDAAEEAKWARRAAESEARIKYFREKLPAKIGNQQALAIAINIINNDFNFDKAAMPVKPKVLADLDVLLKLDSGVLLKTLIGMIRYAICLVDYRTCTDDGVVEEVAKALKVKYEPADSSKLKGESSKSKDKATRQPVECPGASKKNCKVCKNKCNSEQK